MPGASSGNPDSYTAATAWHRAPSSRSRPLRNAISSRNDPAHDLGPQLPGQQARPPWRCPPWPARRPRSVPCSRPPAPSRWHSRESVPYSSAYSSVTRSHGSLPGFRTGTKPAPSAVATAPPRMKPRASMPTTWVTPAARERLGERLDDGAQERPVAEHRRDVLEDDAGLGVVRDRPKGLADSLLHRHRGTHRMSKLLGDTVSSTSSSRSSRSTLECGRPRSKQLLQLRERGRLAGRRHHLDAPVREVLGVAAQPERTRVARHEPAEPDALHHARDQEPGRHAGRLLLALIASMAIGRTESATIARITSVKFFCTTGIVPKK